MAGFGLVKVTSEAPGGVRKRAFAEVARRYGPP